jgi:hypothetical protein
MQKQVNGLIEKYFQSNFGKFMIRNSKLLEAELVPRREYEVTKATLERQVSQTNSIFMIVDKCERYCRDMEKEFQNLMDSFNSKAGVHEIIRLETGMK